MDSTRALALRDVPRRLLVVGGGVIGLELATVYEALGSRVSVVELLPELLTGVDADLVRPLRKRIERRYEAIWCGTRLLGLRAEPGAMVARFEGPDAPAEASFDRVLVAVGRTGRGDEIGAERAGLRVDPRGFLAADAQQRTNLKHVFAIGDVTGPPLLAHRAMHQGRVAAEVIAGLPAAYDPAAVPSVAYTDPEVAWAGITESEAKQQGIALRKAVFPWAVNARALGLGREEGQSKLLFSEETGRLLGAGIVGARAGELIAEAVVAIELGADAEDLALSIHPHPTLSETLGLAAELAAGTITDLLPPRRREPGPR
jgi:dihydrolipoamide dehydrogenase